MQSSSPVRATARPAANRRERAIAAFLLVAGSAIVAIWILSLATGAFATGVFTYQDGNYPILHLIAELVMGALACAAGVGLWRGSRWGARLALFALGWMCYSAINSAGWAIANDPALLFPMIVTLAGAALAVPYLLRGAR